MARGGRQEGPAGYGQARRARRVSVAWGPLATLANEIRQMGKELRRHAACAGARTVVWPWWAHHHLPMGRRYPDAAPSKRPAHRNSCPRQGEA